jgi:3-oxoacyl-[acyl-carrier protein] reductase
MDLGLSGYRAIVTGGSANIGLAIAKALVQEGAAVGICGRDQERLNSATAVLSAEGTAFGVVADVTAPAHLERGVAELVEKLGGLDILIACAGGDIGGPWFPKTTSEDWAATLHLNVVHSADAVRAALPHLRRSQNGSVLFISSITGWRPGPSVHYAAAKAALIHMAASLAQELGPYGIRVNALSPGSVADTDGWMQFARENLEWFARFEKEDFAMGRLVTARQVADVACVVVSPRGAGVNGANIPVDAGQYRPHAYHFPKDV